MNTAWKYVIVSPVRNEGKHIRHTLESVTRQTVKPEEWIVVDDGSGDDTPEIVRDTRNSSGSAWSKERTVGTPNRAGV